MHLKMKSILTLLVTGTLLNSCGGKTELKPNHKDTINLQVPAAPDTLKLQQRPADSLLKTRKY